LAWSKAPRPRARVGWSLGLSLCSMRGLALRYLGAVVACLVCTSHTFMLSSAQLTLSMGPHCQHRSRLGLGPVCISALMVNAGPTACASSLFLSQCSKTDFIECVETIRVGASDPLSLLHPIARPHELARTITRRATNILRVGHPKTSGATAAVALS